MKILVLGGSGAMGRAAVRNLVDFQEVQDVIIADTDVSRALQLKDALASDKLSVLEVDARDPEGLVAAMRRCDVVANAVGPFFEHGLTITRAAIEAKCNYVDICDDYDVTEEQLKLHDDATRAQVTILINLGASPGIVNLLARYGASKLDSPETIRIYFCGAGVGASTPDRGAYVHMIRAAAGDVPIYRDGKMERVPAWEDGEYFDFPPPFERIQVFPVGHPEPVTIPRFIPGLREVHIKGALFPEEETESLREKARGHSRPLRPGVLPETPLWRAPEGFQSGGLSVVIEGEKSSRRVQYTYHVSNVGGGMAALTGVPLAIGAVMVGLGRVKDQGVVAPEGCIDIEDFFARLLMAYSRRARRPISFVDLICEDEKQF